jgi:hypothetical protein
MNQDEADQQPDDLPPDEGDSPADSDENLIQLLGSEPQTPPPPRPFFRRDFGLRRATTVFTIQNLDHRRMTFHVSGAQSYQGHIVEGWRIDFGSLNVQMNDLGRFIATYHAQDDATGREAWRHTAEEIGMHLYSGLMNTDSLLAQQLDFALRRAFPAESLALVFEGPRDYLSVPYELLHDGRTPLALRHPLCRKIAGITPRQSEPFHALIAQLKANHAPLKVLLISSGTRSVAADQEIEILETSIQDTARRADLDTTIEVVWGRSAHIDEIKRKLAQCPYHIVHYSGQVYHDKLRPELGGLLFSADHEEQTGQALVMARELGDLLRGSATRLFFVSACIGVSEWDAYVLRDQNYLSLIETLAQAGIPYTLGFRWHVTNEGRQRFARHFYESLLAEPFAPERAALRARQAVHRRDAQDETWASPILILLANSL